MGDTATATTTDDRSRVRVLIGPAVNPDPQRERLIELARLFLWLGTIGFGGPPAHLTLIEEATVRRREWLSPEAFVDLVADRLHHTPAGQAAYRAAFTDAAADCTTR